MDLDGRPCGDFQNDITAKIAYEALGMKNPAILYTVDSGRLANLDLLREAFKRDYDFELSDKMMSAFRRTIRTTVRSSR